MIGKSDSRLPSFHFHEFQSWTHQFKWLAVIGSTKFLNAGWRLVVQARMDEFFDVLDIHLSLQDRELGIVSGGAEGTDSYAIEYADDKWYRKCVYPPKNHRWEPEGFKERNLLIAKTATWGLAFRCEASKTFGTGFTAQTIEDMGKPVTRYWIHKNPGCQGCLTGSSWENEGCKSDRVSYR